MGENVIELTLILNRFLIQLMRKQHLDLKELLSILSPLCLVHSWMFFHYLKIKINFEILSFFYSLMQKLETQ